MMTERQAWKRFLTYVQQARPALDGCVPGARICVPVQEVDTEGRFVLAQNSGARGLWPKDVPIEARGPLLAWIAQSYLDGTVTR